MPDRLYRPPNGKGSLAVVKLRTVAKSEVVSVPKALYKQLGLKPGDFLVMRVRGSQITIEALK